MSFDVDERAASEDTGSQRERSYKRQSSASFARPGATFADHASQARTVNTFCAEMVAHDVGGAVAAAFDLMVQIERALPRLRDGLFAIRANGVARVISACAGIAIVEADCASRRVAHAESLCWSALSRCLPGPADGVKQFSCDAMRCIMLVLLVALREPHGKPFGYRGALSYVALRCYTPLNL